MLKYDNLEFEIQIIRALSLTFWQLQNHMNKLSSKHGLTIEHCGLMGRLEYNEGCTQQDLADDTLKSKSAIARLITNMVKRGLVFRHQEEDDRRVNYIYLTPKGKEMIKEMKHQIIDEVRKVVKTCSDEDLQVMVDTLLKMGEEINKQEI